MSNHPRRSWRARLAADAEALGPDLVRSYIALYPSPTAAVQALPGNHSLARLGEWRRGDRPVPEPVQRAMRAAVLGRLLGETGENVARVLEGPPTS